MPPFEIDLRSDTVTIPTEEMRQAMATAVVGDDGYGEDTTVQDLEERFAKRVGKEAAVFVPSGTMANQIAVRILTQPGDVIVVGARQHIVLYEMGATACNSGIQFAPIDDSLGVLDPQAIIYAIAGALHHQPEINAVFVENTHMPSGGLCWTSSQLREVADVAGGRPIHLDGARLFNAEVATGESAATLAKSATTVMCCLSKGLSAPVGSLLAGPASLIVQARVERKRLGGAMRQAGVLAAPGILALETMVERLADDHRRAHQLAEAVATRWPEQSERVLAQPTNLVVFDHNDPDSLLSHLERSSIAAGTLADGVARFVTHRGIGDADVERVVAALESAP